MRSIKKLALDYLALEEANVDVIPGKCILLIQCFLTNCNESAAEESFATPTAFLPTLAVYRLSPREAAIISNS
jgi:hypothetical protein